MGLLGRDLKCGVSRCLLLAKRLPSHDLAIGRPWCSRSPLPTVGGISRSDALCPDRQLNLEARFHRTGRGNHRKLGDDNHARTSSSDMVASHRPLARSRNPCRRGRGGSHRQASARSGVRNRERIRSLDTTAAFVDHVSDQLWSIQDVVSHWPLPRRCTLLYPGTNARHAPTGS